jgi:hypothetical protein
MDADRIARSLSTTPSRRGVSRALAGLTLSGLLAPLIGLAGTEARKRKKKGKRRNHRGGKRSPTCSDGKKNGSKSDVDCGGACPRCANGRNCATRSDCAGGLCAGGTCQACAVDDDCGEDADDFCYCAQPATGGSNVCTKANQTGGNVTSCTLCPPGTFCFDEGTDGVFSCFKPCGAPY